MPKQKTGAKTLADPKQVSGPIELPSNDARKNDLKASLKIIGWLNDTLDIAAKSAGKHVSRDAVLALLILHKNREAEKGR